MEYKNPKTSAVLEFLSEQGVKTDQAIECHEGDDTSWEVGGYELRVYTKKEKEEAGIAESLMEHEYKIRHEQTVNSIRCYRNVWIYIYPN